MHAERGTKCALCDKELVSRDASAATVPSATAGDVTVTAARPAPVPVATGVTPADVPDRIATGWSIQLPPEDLFNVETAVGTPALPAEQRPAAPPMDADDAVEPPPVLPPYPVRPAVGLDAFLEAAGRLPAVVGPPPPPPPSRVSPVPAPPFAAPAPPPPPPPFAGPASPSPSLPPPPSVPPPPLAAPAPPASVSDPAPEKRVRPAAAPAATPSGTSTGTPPPAAAVTAAASGTAVFSPGFAGKTPPPPPPRVVPPPPAAVEATVFAPRPPIPREPSAELVLGDDTGPGPGAPPAPPAQREPTAELVLGGDATAPEHEIPRESTVIERRPPPAAPPSESTVIERAPRAARTSDERETFEAMRPSRRVPASASVPVAGTGSESDPVFEADPGEELETYPRTASGTRTDSGTATVPGAIHGTRGIPAGFAAAGVALALAIGFAGGRFTAPGVETPAPAPTGTAVAAVTLESVITPPEFATTPDAEPVETVAIEAATPAPTAARTAEPVPTPTAVALVAQSPRATPRPAATAKAAAKTPTLADATALADAGKLDEAISALEAIVKAEPANADARWILALSYRALRKGPRACPQFAAYVKQAPSGAKAPEAKRHLSVCNAVALLDKEKLDEAHAAFQQIVRTSWTFPDGHYWLGTMQALRNENAPACTSFKSYLRLDAKGPYSDRARAQISALGC